MMKKTVSILLTALILTACEDFFDSPIDYDIERPDPSLVVNAQLSPGQIPTVEVSNSASVFSNNPNDITVQTDAVVIMKADGVFWDTLSYDGMLGYFYAPNAIQPNKNYSIHVAHPDFKTANATTSVPSFVNPVTFEWVDKDAGRAKLRLTPLTNNRYYFIRFIDDNFGGAIWFRTASPVLETESDPFSAIDGGDEYFYEGWIRPERMNGAEQEIIVELNNYNWGTLDQVSVQLTVLEEDLFRYQRDLRNADPDNPFAEPVQVHSNVIDGYGLFSAFAQTLTPIQ